MHVWSQVHKAFSVVSAQDIPADQLDSARNFIAAYAIEGEWLPKEEMTPVKHPSGIHLSRHETQHLYLLMSRFFMMNLHQDQLRKEYIALNSEPLKMLWSHLRESISSFRALDRRRTDIYSEYCALGMTGGYALRLQNSAQ